MNDDKPWRLVKLHIGLGNTCTGDLIPTNEADYAMREALCRMAAAFGGANATRGQGAWLDPDGHLVVEPNGTVESYVAPGQPLNAAYTIAEQVRVRLNQESVLVTVSEVRRALFVDDSFTK